jgi:prevent-host-death family protein
LKSWPVQDAKARFSEFLQATLKDGPQLVTMRGTEAAVLVRIDEWRRLTARARADIKAVLLATEARDDLSIPLRGQLHRRAPRKVV